MSETDEPVQATPDTPVDEAMGALADLETTPLEQHPDVYQQIHTSLQSALTDVDGS